jgi:hypothetical protein
LRLAPGVRVRRAPGEHHFGSAGRRVTPVVRVPSTTPRVLRYIVLLQRVDLVMKRGVKHKG